MNAKRLRTQLRLGGWDAHATNLADSILSNGGLPLERRARGRTLRISLDTTGELVAYLQTGADRGELVATETSVRLRMSEVPVDARPSRRDPVMTVRLPADMVRRLDTRAGVKRESRSALIRKAVQIYLDSFEEGEHA